MVAHVQTVCFQGMQVHFVDIQVQMTPGLPCFNVVGLPDKAVSESRERIRSALYALGLSIPPKRIIVNLAPADIQKEGTHYDLPIALGVLAELNLLPSDALNGHVIMGELALDGHISPVSGALSAAFFAHQNQHSFICPHDCGGEAAWIEGLQILAPMHLLALLNHFKGTQLLRAPEAQMQSNHISKVDMKDVRFQSNAKRALEIAAAGGHNVMMIGPPGGGKSMLAARMPSILPDLDPIEALSVTMIHSRAGKLSQHALMRQRPFRAPHHSASMAALIGGGLHGVPGEVSLAHQGILFLDELPEFSRASLEALRQPLELRHASIARVRSHITYPAKFQLIAAMNPCRCGYFGDAQRACRRAPVCAEDYQNRLSGPFLDRIDLFVYMPELGLDVLSLHQTSVEEPSATIQKRVIYARKIQKKRFQHMHRIDSATCFNFEADYLNSDSEGEFFEQNICLEQDAQTLLHSAVNHVKISARQYKRILRVARTVADLSNRQNISKSDVAEALSYRLKPMTSTCV